MFGRKTFDLSRLVEDKGETVVSATTSFTGTIKSDGLITVHGRVEGEIETAGALLIGKQGQVRANIMAQNVAVAGAVVGNIAASERLEIASTGKILGDITTACLVVEEGGFFHGHSTMTDPDASRLQEPAAQGAAA